MTHIMAAMAAAGWFLLGDPILAGSLAVYREFSIGSSVSEVLASGRLPESGVRTLHERPAVIREAQWRPQYRQIAAAGDPVRDIRFRFSNDRLYQVLVTYDRARMEGLTNGDVIELVSAVYGMPLLRDSRAALAVTEREPSPDMIVVAQWQDADTLLTLSSGPYAQFQLELISKALETRARADIAEALRLAVLDAPQREKARRASEVVAADLLKENVRYREQGRVQAVTRPCRGPAIGATRSRPAARCATRARRIDRCAE